MPVCLIDSPDAINSQTNVKMSAIDRTILQLIHDTIKITQPLNSSTWESHQETRRLINHNLNKLDLSDQLNSINDLIRVTQLLLAQNLICYSVI